MSTLAGRTTTLPHMKHKANPYHIIATMYLFLTAGIALMLTSPIVNVAKAEPANPSFDCRKARDPDERAICSDSRLAELDQAVAIAYGQASKESKFKQDAHETSRRVRAARLRRSIHAGSLNDPVRFSNSMLMLQTSISSR